MKKIFAFALAALALTAVSCTKEAGKQETATVEKTFVVNAPVEQNGEGSRTYLEGTKTILWSASDEINVIAATTGNQYTFTLKDGAGKASASFSGEIAEADAEETVFYALYPNLPIKTADLANGKISLNSAIADTQKAVKNGYDPAFGIMTAVAQDGAFTFRHGMAYFKIQVGTEGVYAVRVETSNSRFGGRPVYLAETGATSSIESATGRMSATIKSESGPLEKDAVYYIPVTVKNNSSIQTLTVTYFYDEDLTASASLETNAKSKVKLAEGQIYNLGCPPISNDPQILADDVTVNADVTRIEVPYTLVNPVEGGYVGARIDPIYDNTLIVNTLEEGESSCIVLCDANTDTENAKSARIVFLYVDPSQEKPVATDTVVVTQKKASAASSHVYTIYASASKTIVQTADGEEGGDYFTSKGTSCANFSAGDTGNYNVASFNIGGTDYYSGIKLDSNGGVQFTTSATATTTVQFWFARRKNGDSSAKIKLVEGDWSSSTKTVELATPFGTAGDSGEIELKPGTQYSIVRSDKEQALILVVVTES